MVGKLNFMILGQKDASESFKAHDAEGGRSYLLSGLGWGLRKARSKAFKALFLGLGLMISGLTTVRAEGDAADPNTLITGLAVETPKVEASDTKSRKDRLSKAGLYPMGGKLLIDRNVQVGNVSVSTLTVLSSATISNLSVVNLNGAAFAPFRVICTSTSITQFTTNSGSFQSTPLGCSGALSNASNHVKITVSGALVTLASGVIARGAIFADATNLDDATQGQCALDVAATGVTVIVGHCFAMSYYLPGDTNTHAYRMKVLADSGAGTIRFGNTNTTWMIVEEVN